MNTTELKRIDYRVDKDIVVRLLKYNHECLFVPRETIDYLIDTHGAENVRNLSGMNLIYKKGNKTITVQVSIDTKILLTRKGFDRDFDAIDMKYGSGVSFHVKLINVGDKLILN
jgi:hypothetical protein